MTRSTPWWVVALIAVVVSSLTSVGLTTVLGSNRATGGTTSDGGATSVEVATAEGAGTSPPGTTEAALSPSEIARRVLPSVASVEVSTVARGPAEARRSATAEGSPVILTSDGYLLTNNHLVEGASRVRVTLADGTSHDADIVGTDPTSDLAVLKVEATSLPAATFADSLPDVGATTIAIGSPFGLEGSVTEGIVSALDRALSDGTATLTGLIQTDAAINPGNSGGALVDDQGRIIGINTAIYSSTGTNDGVGFAVPATTATDVAAQLIKGGTVSWPVLGIRGQDVDPTLARAYGPPTATGALIREVTAGSGATNAGLRAGDIVVAVDDTTITSMSDLTAVIRSRQVGDTVTVTILRGSEELRRDVTLTAG